MSALDHRLEPESEVRRFEVITGAMGRRRWTADDRARIVEETLAPGAVVSVVARRHGLTPQQVFTWRREARLKTEEAASFFVPAVVMPDPVKSDGAEPSKKRRPRRRVAAIELEVAGVTVRVGDGATPTTIEAVIKALKAAT